jgi:hypothetical protein
MREEVIAVVALIKKVKLLELTIKLMATKYGQQINGQQRGYNHWSSTCPKR